MADGVQLVKFKIELVIINTSTHEVVTTLQSLGDGYVSFAQASEPFHMANATNMGDDYEYISKHLANPLLMYTISVVNTHYEDGWIASRSEREEAIRSYIPGAQFFYVDVESAHPGTEAELAYGIKLTNEESGNYAFYAAKTSNTYCVDAVYNRKFSTPIGFPGHEVGFSTDTNPNSYSGELLVTSGFDANGNIIGLNTSSLIGMRYYRSNSTTYRDTEVRTISNTILRSFLDWCNGLVKTDIPTPPGEDDDPYSDIDGMGEITGGGSGAVGVPGFPGLTATGAGVIGLFAPSAAQMQALSDYMWTDFGGTGTTTDEILGEIVQALKRSISNPLDYVVGLNIIPSQGLSIGGSSTIRFGFTSSGVSMPRLSNQYFTVNCGSLSFAAVCGNTFLDYAPYSKFSIYLPYIGVKEVDANDFVGHTIGVTYHGDVVTGGVTAYITKDGSVMYQYSGCCALNVPLSADGWGSTIAGAVQIATSMVAAFGGGAAGVATAAAEGAASVAANPSLLSPQVAHSGAVSGGAGCMGVQYPFVIRETVRFHSTSHFNKLAGYPSFYYRLLSNVQGFTKVLDVHLNDIPATVDEITEIETLLRRGVIL